MARPATFFTALEHTETTGASGLDFPARWFYTRLAPGRFLRASTRFWKPIASCPRPLALRSGEILARPV